MNGRSVAKRAGDRLRHLAFPVAYEPGEAVLRGTRGGRTVTCRMATPGPAVRLVLTPDRTRLAADGADATVVNVQALDEKGDEAFDACDEVSFACAGAGKIIGVGNGDPLSHEDEVCPDGWRRKLFNGKCQLVVKAGRENGELRVKAALGSGRAFAETVVAVGAEAR